MRATFMFAAGVLLMTQGGVSSTEVLSPQIGNLEMHIGMLEADVLSFKTEGLKGRQRSAIKLNGTQLARILQAQKRLSKIVDELRSAQESQPADEHPLDGNDQVADETCATDEVNLDTVLERVREGVKRAQEKRDFSEFTGIRECWCRYIEDECRCNRYSLVIDTPNYELVKKIVTALGTVDDGSDKTDDQGVESFRLLMAQCTMYFNAAVKE